MAWTSADQNPSLAPAPGLSSPSYAMALQQAAQYGAPPGGSSSTGMAPAAQASGGSYAERLNATAAPVTPWETRETSRELATSADREAAANRYVSTLPDRSNLSRTWRRAGPMKDVGGMVFHHTAGTSFDDAMTTLNRRGLGAQYIIDRDGSVYRTFPEGRSAIHMREPGSRYRKDRSQPSSGYGNANLIGVEVVGLDNNDILPEQVQAATRLARGLSTQYGFPLENIWGHGELQSNKQGSEGMQIVSAIRGLPPPPAVEGSRYAGDPFGVSGAREQAAMAGGTAVPTPRLRPDRTTEMAYAPAPEAMDQAPFDAVLGASRDRRPQPPTPQANPRRDRLQAAAPAPAGGGYVVRRGDNLSKIAQRELGDANRWREIAAANNLRNPNRLQPGQRLVIPGGGAQAPAPAAAQPRREVDIPQPRPRPERGAGVPTPPSNPRRDPNGFPIDVNRPRLNNGDGTFSTEQTITFDASEVGLPSEIVTIPTIINGQKVSDQTAMAAFARGLNEPVQRGFSNFEEADKAAIARTDSIARARATNGERGFPQFYGEQPRPPAPAAPSRGAPRATRETWNSMGLGSRGNAETQMSIDRPPQRRPAAAPPPPGPYDDQSRQYDTPGPITQANERMGVFEGTPAPENWRPRPNFSAADPSTRVPPTWSPVTEFPPAPVPAGPGMDTSGLIRPPAADERALQTGARPRLPTGSQPMDPRNAAQMDRADGVFRPLAVPGGPPWVASNGIRFYAVR